MLFCTPTLMKPWLLRYFHSTFILILTILTAALSAHETDYLRIRAFPGIQQRWSQLRARPAWIDCHWLRVQQNITFHPAQSLTTMKLSLTRYRSMLLVQCAFLLVDLLINTFRELFRFESVILLVIFV